MLKLEINGLGEGVANLERFRPTNLCGTYNARAAVAYAKRFNPLGCSDDNGARNERNHDYGYYGGRGGDCTNFASQMLKAGGMRFMRACNRPLASVVNRLVPDGDTFIILHRVRTAANIYPDLIS